MATTTAVSSSAELKQRIADLEMKRKRQRTDIVDTVHGMMESVKPKNLVKAGLQSISETPALRQNLINALISLSSGWIARKLAVPKADTAVRKAVGSAVQYGVSHLIATQGDHLGDLIHNFTKNFKRKDKLPQVRVEVPPPK
jgi:hypothetical protein